MGCFGTSAVLACMETSPEKGFELHASKRRRSRRIGGKSSAGVDAADEEASRADGGRGDRQSGGNSAQQSGGRRIHAEAEQLRQVLSTAQAGNSQKDSVYRADDPDQGQTEGQVREFGGIAAT